MCIMMKFKPASPNDLYVVVWSVPDKEITLVALTDKNNTIEHYIGEVRHDGTIKVAAFLPFDVTVSIVE